TTHRHRVRARRSGGEEARGLPLPKIGAQRASAGRSIRLTVLAVAVTLVALGGWASEASPVSAAGMKVVVIVGPAGSSTSKYITTARSYASPARSYGARVIELYRPNATCSR